MPFPGIGGAQLIAKGKGPKVIRLALHGHANRPFFHIVLTNQLLDRTAPPVEQLGTYDPMPNADNQKLVSLNVERVRYWMGQGAFFSQGLQKLLGIVGFLPIHPETYRDGWRARFKEAEEAKKAQEKVDGDGAPSSSASS